MTPAEYHDRELGELRERFEAGYFPALLEAFRFCVVSEIALPEWLAQAIMPELIFAFQENGKTRGRGGRVAKAKQIENEQARYDVAEMMLRGRKDWEVTTVKDGELGIFQRFTRDDAFEAARQMLVEADHPAGHTTANEIRKSHAKVKRDKSSPKKAEKK